MQDMIKNEYDVVIIGSGLGGLICGCYLSKHGLKVLIIEKNKEIGGYCRSFDDRGYRFNTCIRGLVGGRPGGLLDQILTDLNLKNKITILRPEVYDEIQFLGNSIFLYNNPNKTINGIIKKFPKEAIAIRNFFSLITKEKISTEFFRYRNCNFQQLINRNFKDNRLKLLLSILRIDSGMMSSQTSAVADLMLIRGNVFDGGYFPKGGMQSLTDCFSDYFKNSGGFILTESLATKIKMNRYKATGVFLEKDIFIKAKIVISNSDATFTYSKLLKDAKIEKILLKKIKTMLPSASTFVVYLALKSNLRRYLKHTCCAIWNIQKKISDGLVCVPSSVVDSTLAPKDCTGVTLYYGAPFEDDKFWKCNKEKYTDVFLKRFFKIFPEMKNHIAFYSVATPVDFQRETFNRDGASRGWAPTIQQIAENFPSSDTPIKNVFLAGHWVSSPYGNGGIAFVGQTGRKVALSVINKWEYLKD